MKKLLAFILIIITLSVGLNAQSGNQFRERVKTLKKVKMLEHLDLSTEKADQLILEFNSIEDRMEDANRLLKEAVKSLEAKIKESENDAEKAKLSADQLRELSNDVKQKTEALLNLQKQKMEEFEKILDDFEFAKFIIFEHKFREELEKRLSNRKRKSTREKRRRSEY